MSASKVQVMLNELKKRLQVIRVADGYNTDIGSLVLLSQAQRSKTERPSIAITSRSGVISRAEERDARGNKLSARARRADVVVEAAVAAGSADADALGLLMLEDFERATTAKNCPAPAALSAPLGMIDVQWNNWQILDRPEGIDAVVLQILGSVDYLRT